MTHILAARWNGTALNLSQGTLAPVYRHALGAAKRFGRVSDPGLGRRGYVVTVRDSLRPAIGAGQPPENSSSASAPGGVASSRSSK
jgi:hypothetical protein